MLFLGPRLWRSLLLEPGRSPFEAIPQFLDVGKAKPFRLGQHCRETGMEELTEEVNLFKSIDEHC